MKKGHVSFGLPPKLQDIVPVKRMKAKGEVIEQVSSEQLVPGDVIVIPRHGCTMHVDAVLVTGRSVVILLPVVDRFCYSLLLVKDLSHKY